MTFRIAQASLSVTLSTKLAAFTVSCVVSADLPVKIYLTPRRRLQQARTRMKAKPREL